MSKINIYVCDWCGKEIMKSIYHYYEIENFDEGSDNDRKILDCCANCFNNRLDPRNFAELKKGIDKQ